MVESEFQKRLKKEIKERFPGCYILKNDANDIQGIPDLTILYEDRWAMLEVKKSKTAKHRPNQDVHVARLDSMSFAAFIFPENKEEILNELERTFRPSRKALSIQSEPADVL